jgi:hypothetical protein
MSEIHAERSSMKYGVFELTAKIYLQGEEYPYYGRRCAHNKVAYKYGEHLHSYHIIT